MQRTILLVYNKRWNKVFVHLQFKDFSSIIVLQEMNRQQSEVVNSLLNVIEELLEENKKLRATDK